MTNFLRNTINRIRRFIGLGGPSGPSIDQSAWIRVGEVTQLIVYPLWESSTKLVIENAVCTTNGLMYEGTYDGIFVIYRSDSKEICTFREFPALSKLNIHRYNGIVTLDSEFHPTIQFNCFYGEIQHFPITPIWIHKDEVIFARDCGSAAGEWVSEYLLKSNKGMRLGYYIYSDCMDFLATTRDTWYDYLTSSDNPHKFHLDATNRYSLLNVASFDKINNRVSFIRGPLMELDFRPNIVILTENEDAYSEFTWTDIMIGNCIFEVIPSCQLCMQDILENYFGHHSTEKETFVNKLRFLIKRFTNVKVKRSKATLTINLKLVSVTGEPIMCGNNVFVKKKVVRN